jgi:adenosine/AMP kinase
LTAAAAAAAASSCAPAAHFIKTVEDIYEALVQSSTALKFGIAFNEASPGYEAMPGAMLVVMLQL